MLQFISHSNSQHDYLDGIKLALAGGCKWIQLRMKDSTPGERQRIAILAKQLCRDAGATFIIDDDVELVMSIGADGVHLGKKDMPISEARRILGNDFIIGGTANTFEDVVDHWMAGANYIGCGPFRFTTTKKGLSPVLGLNGYRSIVAKMREEKIDLPIVAIGGITADDIPDIMQTGVTGIALSGAILNAESPVEETEKIIKIIEKWKN